jgi:hypothetical protein
VDRPGSRWSSSERDELIGCEAAQALEGTCKVVAGAEVVGMSPEPVVAVVIEALDRGLLDPDR